MLRHNFFALLLACGGLGAAGCGDPVVDTLVASLGPEADEVPAGPNHRPGQPCVACHRKEGAAQTVFALAGTIYREKGGAVPLAEVDVELTDARGRRVTARSNCAGNFFVYRANFVPSFPVWVTLRKGTHAIDMESPIYREGSCASCHTEPASPTSAGAVFLTDEPAKAQLFPATPPCP